jgi:hypothetical protein
MTAAKGSISRHLFRVTVMPAGLLDLPIAPIRFIYFQN